MANDFDLQDSCDDTNHRQGLNIARMAIELDEFVNEVSMELSLIGRQLGQAPEVRTPPRSEIAPRTPAVPEPISQADWPPSRTSSPTEKRAADNRSQSSASRIQTIRNRLAKVNSGRTGNERGARENE